MYAIAVVAAMFTAASDPAIDVTVDTPAFAAAPTVYSARVVRRSADSSAEHVERGRRAQAAGDLELAHMEFARAVRIDRTNGVLSVDATYGAAQVLTMMSRHRDAAVVLDQLAADANLLGDAETEARVLLDAVAVKVKGRQSATARADVKRLLQLVEDERLSADTRRLIRVRLV